MVVVLLSGTINNSGPIRKRGDICNIGNIKFQIPLNVQGFMCYNN